MLERLTADVITAARSLRRMPLLVGGAVLTLALAVGLNVAVLGLIDRALFAAPPNVAEPGRLFALGFAAPDDEERPATMRSTSYVAFNAIREAGPAIAGAAAFQRASATLMLGSDQRSLSAMLVSGGYFTLLGARPLLGRNLDPGDDAAAAVPVVILSHAFWRATLQEDRGVLGRRLVINGVEYAVKGVMPEGFTGHTTARVDAWLPFAVAMRGTPGWDLQAFRNVAGVLVRLAPAGDPVAAAAQAQSAILRRVAMNPVAGAEVAPTERTVALWLGGVALLVLIAGLANGAILLVVRGIRSRRLMAIRAALGASRARLRFEALLEGLWLAAAVTLISLILSSWLNDALRSVLFPDLLSRTPVGAFGWATAVLGGLAALAVAAGAGLSQIPSEGLPIHRGAEPSGVTRRSRTMTVLLLVQTTLAVLLLASAGLFGASLHRLGAQDFGMAMDGVIVVDFEQTSADIAGQDRLLSEGLERVKALPGVGMATVIDAIPFAGFNVPPIAVPGRAEPPSVGGQLPFLTAATPEFLTILGVRVVEGRSFTGADDRGAPVVIVNQAMARAVWPGESAIGKCIRIGFDPDFDPSTFNASAGPPMPSPGAPCREVVGVTADVRQRSVLPTGGEDRLMQYFVPFSQVPTPPFAPNPTRIRGLLLKVDARSPGLLSAIRRAVVSGHANLPYLRVRPYAELLEVQMRPWSMGTRLLGLFSTLALAVAAIGIFAAFAHAVAERRREMAIRLAVGARPAEVLRMVLGEALLVAAGGVAIGGVSAVLSAQGLRSLLFATEPFDPLVLAASSALMLLIAALATFAPAREAAHLDPSVLLRAE